MTFLSFTSGFLLKITVVLLHKVVKKEETTGIFKAIITNFSISQ